MAQAFVSFIGLSVLGYFFVFYVLPDLLQMAYHLFEFLMNIITSWFTNEKPNRGSELNIHKVDFKIEEDK